MSATPAQLEANRANAEASTGPKTEEGKKTASQNALKHGLACGRVIIEGENPDDLRRLTAELRREHQPLGRTEELLVDKMALSVWLSRRALVFQSFVLAEAPETDPVPEKLAVLLRYQTTNDRAFYKSLDTLRALQKERRQNPVTPPPHSLADQIGFVQQATAEQLWDFAVEQHKKQFPHEPFPEFTPEEKEKLIDSLR